MDPQPRVTQARTRAGRSNDDGGFEPRRSASLRHNILGPPPDALQDPRSPAETPATPPPTQGQPFVQPPWIVPRLSGEAALQARNAIRDSRSATAASIAANSAAPGSPRSPNYVEIRGPATLASPMDQDYPGSEEEWFGVAVSHPYEPNGASATSGEEGRVPSHRSYHYHGHPSPGEDDYMRHSPSRDPPSGGEPEQGLNPLEVSPSVRIRDFTEVQLPAPHVRSQAEAPPRGPFRDPSLAELQPALEILPSHNTQPSQRGRACYSNHHQQSHPRARTREPSPGPDFGTHLRRSSRSLSLAAHYAPARFDASSLRVGSGSGKKRSTIPRPQAGRDLLFGACGHAQPSEPPSHLGSAFGLADLHLLELFLSPHV
ncbi:MAG: hypothetical protein NXY57DRAFT_963635 [Lentinula lateritia]|nr:MAG: hypothetical protein NXY57DRAFT_963635 [Lentinula lateritia]